MANRMTDMHRHEQRAHDLWLRVKESARSSPSVDFADFAAVVLPLVVELDDIKLRLAMDLNDVNGL